MAKDKKSIKFEADVKGFKTNIKEAEKNIKNLNNQLKLNQEKLKGSSNSIELLQDELDVLNSKYEEQKVVVDNTRKELEKATEIFGENSTEAENLENKLLQAETAEQKIKNAIDKTNKEIKEQVDNAKDTSKKWKETGEAIEIAGEKIDKAGNKLSILSGIVGTTAGLALKASIDFETAFTGVTKTVDGTEEQLAELRQGILDMSTEIPSTAGEISAVAEAAGQLGIKTEDVLAFTRVMIDLGNSTNVSADEAASSLAKFANVTKMSAEDYSRLGSTIVALGNNYATTEADIIAMSQNLASAGTQVGMTQADIMALATALSSVGLEAQAGGTAFSKALVEMQLAVETNSDDLKNWADVAGMSVDEFSKLFKEDATSALQAFIQGLSECGGETESAIKVLDDMGITETRMRDALLRSANASDTFTSAIKLGSKAWGENRALTEEAEKKYSTTESQMKMLKNEVTKIAIEFGNQLAPSLRQIAKDVKPMLEKVASAVKAFANLDEKTKKNIISMGTLVVAAGPIVKIIGKVTTAVGSGAKAIGTFQGAIKILNGNTKKATDSSKKLASAIKAIKSPAGIATIAVTALGVAYELSKKRIEKATEATKKQAEASKEAAEKAKEQLNSTEDLRNSINNGLQVDLDNIDRTKTLWNELKKITDENGKIKEGYEGRAKVITEELSEATETEISITDGVIEKYKKLESSIDSLILKKKASAILSASEEKYNNAVANKGQINQDLITTEDELKKAREEEERLYREYQKTQEYKNNPLNMVGISYFYYSEKVKIAKQNWENAKTNTENLQRQYDTLHSSLSATNQDIKDYEYNLELYYEGTEEAYTKMTNGVTRTHIENNQIVTTSWERQVREIQNELKIEQQAYEDAEKKHNETEISKSKSSIEGKNQRLKALSEELESMTSIQGENSEDVKAAWRILATDSYDVYSEIVKNMPKEMQDVVQEITGVIVTETPKVADTTGGMADKIIEKLNVDEKARKSAVSLLNNYLKGLSDEEQRRLLFDAGIENVEEVMQALKEGDLSEEAGVKILQGFGIGLDNQYWKNKIFEKANSIAKNMFSGLINTFQRLNNNGSTSTNAAASAALIGIPGHKTGLAYVPRDNYVARLHKGERVLTAEENKQFMADNLENKISNTSIVVQFYPQTMNEKELQRAEKYIARKWGMEW